MATSEKNKGATRKTRPAAFCAITLLNRAAEKITGFRAAQAVGQCCFDIIRADIYERNCAIDRTLESAESQINLPGCIITQDGEAQSIRLSTAILKNEFGKVYRRSTNRDIDPFR